MSPSVRIEVHGLVVAATLCSSSRAGAEEDWLTLTSSSSCPADAAALMGDIRGRMAGEVRPGTAVEVVFRDAERGYESRLSLRQNGETIGTKSLVAPTCEESIEATAAVVALALSQQHRADAPPSERGTEHLHTAALDAQRPSESPTAPRSVPPAPPPASDGEGSTEQDAAGRTSEASSSLRLLASGGLDTGTVAEPTAMLGSGLIFGLGRSELRATLWYGTPSERVESSSSSLRSTSYDFAAAQVEYCHGLDHGRWLALCGGLIGGFWRVSRAEGLPDQTARRQTRLGWTWGPELGAAFIYRDAPFEPQLAVLAHVPMAGKAEGASDVTFRATLGASLSF